MNIIDTVLDLLNIWSISDGIQEYGGIIIIALTILRISIIIRVANNISKRTDHLGIQILCIIIATLWGPLGWICYLVIRPQKSYKNKESEIDFHDKDEDKNNYENTYEYRESSIKKYSKNNSIPGIITCINCSTNNNEKHNYCSSCGKELKIKCKECHKNIDPSFEYCGYCGAPKI